MTGRHRDAPPPNRWGPIRIAHQTKPRHRSRKLPAICRSGGLDGFGRDCERLGVRRPAGLRHAVTKCAVWPERSEPVGCWAVPKLTSTTPSQGCGSGSVRPSTVRSGPRPAYCRKNGLVVLLPRRPPARRSLSHSGKFDFGLLGQRGVPPRTGRLDRREADRFSYPPCREGDRCAENVILAPPPRGVRGLCLAYPVRGEIAHWALGSAAGGTTAAPGLGVPMKSDGRLPCPGHVHFLMVRLCDALFREPIAPLPRGWGRKVLADAVGCDRCNAWTGACASRWGTCVAQARQCSFPWLHCLVRPQREAPCGSVRRFGNAASKGPIHIAAFDSPQPPNERPQSMG